MSVVPTIWLLELDRVDDYKAVVDPDESPLANSTIFNVTSEENVIDELEETLSDLAGVSCSTFKLFFQIELQCIFSFFLICLHFYA